MGAAPVPKPGRSGPSRTAGDGVSLNERQRVEPRHEHDTVIDLAEATSTLMTRDDGAHAHEHQRGKTPSLPRATRRTPCNDVVASRRWSNAAEASRSSAGVAR